MGRVAERAPRVPLVVAPIEHGPGAARIAMARVGGRRGADGQRVRGARVDAHGPRVPRLDAHPGIAPALAAVVRGEDAGAPLLARLARVHAAVTRAGEQGLASLRMQYQLVDVGIERHLRRAAGIDASPRLARVFGGEDAPDLDPDPPARVVDRIERDRASAPRAAATSGERTSARRPARFGRIRFHSTTGRRRVSETGPRAASRRTASSDRSATGRDSTPRGPRARRTARTVRGRVTRRARHQCPRRRRRRRARDARCVVPPAPCSARARPMRFLGIARPWCRSRCPWLVSRVMGHSCRGISPPATADSSTRPTRLLTPRARRRKIARADAECRPGCVPSTRR